MNPDYRCLPGFDGEAPVPETTPTCPDVTGWTDLCGSGQASGGSGASSSGGAVVDAGSSLGVAASGSSSGSASAAASDVDATVVPGSSGTGMAAAPFVVDADAGSTPPPREELVLGRAACAIEPGSTTEAAGPWSVSLAVGLLLARRKRARPRMMPF
jgi:hypothetical protein